MTDKMRCNICNNYLRGLERCKYCSFEWATEVPWTDDSKWDILDLDDEVEWSHLQIQYRLKAKGIECLSADMWWDCNMAIIIGAKANTHKVARALGVHKEVVYDDTDMGLMILNLYQEKAMRLGLDVDGRYKG